MTLHCTRDIALYTHVALYCTRELSLRWQYSLIIKAVYIYYCNSRMSTVQIARVIN